MDSLWDVVRFVAIVAWLIFWVFGHKSSEPKEEREYPEFPEDSQSDAQSDTKEAERKLRAWLESTFGKNSSKESEEFDEAEADDEYEDDEEYAKENEDGYDETAGAHTVFVPERPAPQEFLSRLAAKERPPAVLPEAAAVKALRRAPLGRFAQNPLVYGFIMSEVLKRPKGVFTGRAKRG